MLLVLLFGRYHWLVSWILWVWVTAQGWPVVRKLENQGAYEVFGLAVAVGGVNCLAIGKCATGTAQQYGVSLAEGNAAPGLGEGLATNKTAWCHCTVAFNCD